MNGRDFENTLNELIRSLRVVSVQRHFCSTTPEPGWAVCVEYVDVRSSTGRSKEDDDNDPGQLTQWHQQIRRWLADHLKLELKSGTRLGRTSEGMEFLGFRLMPGAVLLGARARRRFRERLTAYEKAWQQGRMGPAELQRRVSALIAHTNHARCQKWRAGVLSKSLLANEELL